jgi:hypothetical protein
MCCNWVVVIRGEIGYRYRGNGATHAR